MPKKDKHDDEDSDSQDEEEDHAQMFRYEKCGKGSVDNAIVAVSRWHARNSWSDNQEDWFDQAELLTAIVLYMFVLMVQSLLLYMFYRYWVEIKDDPYENSFYRPMSAAVMNATMWNASLASAGTQAATTASMYCSINRAPPILHIVTLWIWFGEGLSLVCDALWRFYLVWSFTDTHEGSKAFRSQVKDESIDPPPGERDVKVNISIMNTQHKLFTSVVILTPSLLLTMAVAWVGASFISVTTEINLLVKASLKMNFIARMDKILFPSYVSYNWDNYVQNSNFKVSDPFGGMVVLDTWIATVSKSVLGLIASWWCCSMVWPEVEEFRQLCKAYYTLFPWENVMPGALPVPVGNITEGWWYPDI